MFIEGLRVNVQRGSHVAVPQQFLLHLQINAKLPEQRAGAKSLP